MSALDPKEIQLMARDLRGSVLRPGDAGYDEARRVFNGMIDRRPELIVRCENEADVATAIAFASEQSLAVAVRGGGHARPDCGPRRAGARWPASDAKVPDRTHDGGCGTADG